MTTPSTARKAGPFTGNGSQNSWAFTFKVFAASDVKVTVADAAGTETVLVLGTDYTVSLNANQDTSPGGSVTYLLASGGKLTVTGDLDYDQPLDIPAGGNFNPVAFENQLDRMVMQTQQLAEEMARAVKVPVTEAATGQLSTDLANGILALSPIAADIETVAANATAVDNVSDNMEDVAAVGSNISNVGTVAGIASSVTAVAGNATNINAVAAKATQITQVAAIDDEVAAVAGNATNVNTVAGISANVTTVAGISANVTTVAGIAANVTSVAGNATNINAVAGNNANITAVAGNATNINAVVANATNINAVASNSSNISTVAGAATDIAAVADNLADVSNFADVYQGSKTSNPSLRNDGTALQLGDLYFNSVTDTMRAYGAGGWADAASAAPVTITPQTFSGNGSTTAFTLSTAPAFEAACDVYISGVFQVVDVDYNIVGTTLTFTSAPPSGTNNINVKILSSYAAGVPANGSVNTAALADGAVTAEKLAPGAATLTTKMLRARYLTSGTTYTPASDVKEFYAQIYGATGGASAGSLGGIGGPGYSEKYYPAPSGSYTYSIGAGGVLGTAGGTTTFDVMTVTGSAGVTTTTGGAGGVGSGGDFNASGGSGGNRVSTSYGGNGGAGSRAGNGGNGGNDGGSNGQGGTGGNNASGTTPGGYATSPSGSALVMPWGGASESFYGLANGGLGYGAVGVPILNNSYSYLYGPGMYYYTGVNYPAVVPGSMGGYTQPFPYARYGNTFTGGLPAVIVIIEVLK